MSAARVVATGTGAALLALVVWLVVRGGASTEPAGALGPGAREPAREVPPETARVATTAEAPREAVPEPLSPGRARLAEQRPRPPVRPWRVRGRALDERRATIAGARVWIRLRGEAKPIDPRPTVTDERGRFDVELEGPPPVSRSSVVVVAEADGFQRAEQRAAPHRSEERVWEAHVRLEPGRTLTGRVVLPNGAPVAGAEVRFAGAAADELPGEPAWSGRDGRYAVGGTIDADGFVTARKREVGAAALRVDPESIGPDGGLPDLVLELENVLSGRVTYPDGGLARYIDLRAGRVAANPDHPGWGRAPDPASTPDWSVDFRTGADGRFALRDLLAGRYRITASAPDVEESLRADPPAPRVRRLGQGGDGIPFALVSAPSREVELVIDAHRVVVPPPLIDGSPAASFSAHCVPPELYDSPRYHDRAGYGHVFQLREPVGFTVAPEVELVVEVVVPTPDGALRAHRRLTVPHRPYETEVRLELSTAR